MFKFNQFLFESAPRIPNDVEYWKNKGKIGKDVCIIFHDDLDGVVSAILMKKYLLSKGFTIKKYAIINYQESWEALKLDPKLINIALDYAEDAEDVDVYMDHHGSFEEEIRLKQKKHSVKTSTGSAAEGIAEQLGIPFGKEIKDWIDMIDSAKYDYYNVNITDILNFDLKEIKKDKNSKLRFASAFNQLLKRSDHTTFIEVVNAAKDPSIYNLFRLFKIFFPKNNPNWKSGVEPEFIQSGRERLAEMEKKTRGKGNWKLPELDKDDKYHKEEGDKKERYMDYKDFWHDFSVELDEKDVNYDPDDDSTKKWKLKLGSYQIIGNLMFVPSGTWANALRAKAIFVEDKKSGIVPDDTKLNFVMLQYGNTLQVADLDTKIKDMKTEDLPTLKNGNKITNLGKYMSDLVKNFEMYLGYSDDRTFHGGHDGIGTISNIFGECDVKPYEGVKFLDLFKNKIINDLSGVEWALSMPWNNEDKKIDIPEEEINLRMLGDDEIRSEKDALLEKKERRNLSFVVMYDDWDNVSVDKFKLPIMKKMYNFIRENLKTLKDMKFEAFPLSKIYFRSEKADEKALNRAKSDIYSSGIYNEIIDFFDVDTDVLYRSTRSKNRSRERNQTKRIMAVIGNIVNGSYIAGRNKEKYEQQYKKWRKK